MTHPPATPDHVLEVRDLRVSFSGMTGVTHAVKGVSLNVRRGKTLAIVGESGSGKSVTSYSILRLIRPPGHIDGGTITLFDADRNRTEIVGLPENSPELYRLRGGRISMIFQEPMTALSPVHTVGNQLREALRLHSDLSKREIEKRCTEMLDRVGLPDPKAQLRKYPFELSGGMRQRVVIAMALITRPELIIADEPTTALDVTVQAQILELLNDLREHFDGSVLFITHDLGVVAQIADDVAVMQRGRVVESGTVRQIVGQPRHPYTQQLMESMPRLDDDPQRRERTLRERKHFALPAGYAFSAPVSASESRVETGPVMLTLRDRRRLMAWPTGGAA